MRYVFEPPIITSKWVGFADQRKRETKQIEDKAEALGIQVLSLVRAKPLERHLEGAFSSMSREKPDALLLADNELAVCSTAHSRRFDFNTTQ
jgi:hypothetical protein